MARARQCGTPGQCPRGTRPVIRTCRRRPGCTHRPRSRRPASGRRPPHGASTSWVKDVRPISRTRPSTCQKIITAERPYGGDHAEPLAIADHRWSTAVATFWHPTPHSSRRRVSPVAGWVVVSRRTCPPLSTTGHWMPRVTSGEGAPQSALARSSATRSGRLQSRRDTTVSEASQRTSSSRDQCRSRGSRRATASRSCHVYRLPGRMPAQEQHARPRARLVALRHRRLSRRPPSNR